MATARLGDVGEVAAGETHGRQKRGRDQSARILELLAALNRLPHEPFGLFMLAGQLRRHPGQQEDAEAVEFVAWLDRGGARADVNAQRGFSREDRRLMRLAQGVELERRTLTGLGGLDEDGERATKIARSRLDHAAQIEELSAELIRREREDPGDQVPGLVGLSGRPGRPGCSREPAHPAVVAARQLSRARERGCGRGVPRARFVSTRRGFERGSDLFVGADARERLVPDAAIGVVVGAQRRCAQCSRAATRVKGT